MYYFQLLPDISLSTPTSTDNTAKTTAKNIFRSIRFRSDMKRYTQFYEKYIILDGERPMDVAMKFYGDPNYDWLVILFNNIKNVDNEWPRSTQQINEIIRTKYTDPYSVHHYETKQVMFEGIEILPAGKIVQENFTFTTPSQISGFGFNGIITAGSPIIQIKGSAEILSSGPAVFENVFKGGPLFVSPSIFPDGTEIIECRRNIDNTYYVTVDQNALVTSTTPILFGTSKYGPVTLKGEQVIKTVYNQDYEMELNDIKRRISILSPSLLTTVVEEFRQKLAYQELTEYVPEDLEFTIEQKISAFY